MMSVRRVKRLPSLTRPIEMPATWRLDRHAGVHQRRGAAADRGHRRRAVRLGDVGDDADGVRELVLARQRMRRARARRGAPWPISRRPGRESACFADGEGREVVVEHEAFGCTRRPAVDALLVARGAERRGDQRLRFAAREERRAVRARQHAVADSIGAHGARVAAVDARSPGRIWRRTMRGLDVEQRAFDA